ncbi:MAG: hypothetical protein ACE5Q6_19930, partial [Dehalococcoidia bacterium]
GAIAVAALHHTSLCQVPTRAFRTSSDELQRSFTQIGNSRADDGSRACPSRVFRKYCTRSHVNTHTGNPSQPHSRRGGWTGGE